jgi:hypothetical protein
MPLGTDGSNQTRNTSSMIRNPTRATRASRDGTRMRLDQSNFLSKS